MKLKARRIERGDEILIEHKRYRVDFVAWTATLSHVTLWLTCPTDPVPQQVSRRCEFLPNELVTMIEPLYGKSPASADAGEGNNERESCE
jgi:hypothetical protein